jgi:hypothetical protein
MAFMFLREIIRTYSDIDFRRYLHLKVESCYLCVYYRSIKIPLNVAFGSSATISAFGGLPLVFRLRHPCIQSGRRSGAPAPDRAPIGVHFG